MLFGNSMFSGILVLSGISVLFGNSMDPLSVFRYVPVNTVTENGYLNFSLMSMVYGFTIHALVLFVSR